jgi:hypothetical protein
MFPKKKGVEQFTSVDIADYKTYRLQKGITLQHVVIELYYIRRFWNWLILDRDCHLRNPVKAFQLQELGKGYKPKTYTLRLSEINKLLAELPVKEKRIILHIMSGGNCPNGRASHNIKAAARRANLPLGFSLHDLKLACRSRWAAEVVQAYCQEISNSLPTEPQSKSDPFAAIKVPSLDVRTSISDNNNNGAPIILV